MSHSRNSKRLQQAPPRTVYNLILLFFLLLVLLSGCVKPPFIPQNVGKEYGNPKLPLVVSHAKKENQWTLNRIGHSFFLQRAICFDYVCRKMIGDSKVRPVISREEFIEVIRKNGERGFFKTTTPPPQPTEKPKQDTLVVPRDSVTIAEIKAAPLPETPVLKADSLITLNEVFFETNSFRLNEEHLPELDLLNTYLKSNPSLEVSISGHTDNIGEEQYNIMLSTRRAKSVAEYLINGGVDSARVIARGLGSSKPVAGNETAVGRRKNRRVEILIRNKKR